MEQARTVEIQAFLTALSFYWDKLERHWLDDFDFLDDGRFIEAQDEFAKHDIDFKREIWPLVGPLLTQFYVRLSLGRAAILAKKDFVKWVKRYEGPLRTLTEHGAPLPDETKSALQRTLFGLRMVNFEDMLLSVIQDPCQPIKKKIVDRNVLKPSQKHPFWKILQEKLMRIIQAKGISKWKARILIANFLRAFSSNWYDVKFPEDSIRQNVKYSLRVQG